MCTWKWISQKWHSNETNTDILNPGSTSQELRLPAVQSLNYHVEPCRQRFVSVDVAFTFIPAFTFSTCPIPLSPAPSNLSSHILHKTPDLDSRLKSTANRADISLHSETDRKQYEWVRQTFLSVFCNNLRHLLCSHSRPYFFCIKVQLSKSYIWSRICE